MSAETTRSVRPARRLDGLRPYAPPARRSWIDLRLDANEGAAVDAVARVDGESMRRYPDASALEAEIASMWGVSSERVVVTNGGDDAIDRVCRAVLEPGRFAVAHDPTFEMIERSVRLAGADVRRVPWLDGSFPERAFVESMVEGVGLVALVSPNNPTGGVIDADVMLRVADAAAACGALVLADLAYVEFADSDPTRALLERSNVVVVRTFSKALGLAGARVGYALGSEVVAGWLRTAGGPYPVSSGSLACASDALRLDRRGYVARVRWEREAIVDVLTEVGAEAEASGANFVLARFEDAAWVRDALSSVGIGVRSFGRADLSDRLRITLPGEAGGFERLCGGLRSALLPRSLLLDLDGVLADVSASYRAAIAATAASYGVKVTGADVSAMKLKGDANNDWVLTRRLLSARGVDVALGEVIERFQRAYLGAGGSSGLRERETLIPDAALVRRLSGRVTLGLVTGRPRAEAVWFLERFGVSDAFGALVCMEDADAKPSAAPVRLAMERLGVDSAWMVGDTVDDIVSARGAGVVGIGVLAPGDTDDAALVGVGAARVVSGLDDVEAMLR